MSKKLSLQEQLLQSGLVSSAKAKTIKTEKHKQQQAQRHHNVEVLDEAKMWAQKATAEKTERDQLLNLQLHEHAKQKENKAQIKQLIDENKIPFDTKNAEIPYRFTDGITVKTLYVTEDLRTQLVAGKLAIVRGGKNYELINYETALRIKERDGSRILVLIETKNEIVSDDPYAAFEIPDDLMW